jgi:hypothetical protein
MRRWIVRLPVPFIERRREKSFSMLQFQRKERKGQHLFRKGKGARGAALGSRMEGWPEDATSWLFALDTVVEIKQAAEMEWAGKERFLDRKKIVEKNFGCCSLNINFLNFWMKNIGD